MPKKTTPKTTPAKPIWPFAKLGEEEYLWPHASGQWAKKYLGKIYYFGTWEKTEEALYNFRRSWPKILAGEESGPVARTQRITVIEAFHEYLKDIEARHRDDEIVYKSMIEFRDMTFAIAKALGYRRRIVSLGPQDFSRVRDAFAHMTPPARQKRFFHAGTIFNWLSKNRQIPKPEFGSSMRVTKKAIRRYERGRRQSGSKLFAASEIHALIEHADAPMRAWILLGINGGMGPTDISEILTVGVDLEVAPGEAVG